MRSSKHTSRTTTRTAVRFEAEGHRYHLRLKSGEEREVLSVTRALAIAGPRGEWGFDEEAAALGTKVHKTVALWLVGRLDEESLHPILAGYLAGAKKFMLKTRFRVSSEHHVERVVHDPALGVAGTLDLFGKAWKRRVLVDWKSGTTVAPWMELQTGGYLHCARRVGIVEFDEPVERMIVRITRDGEFKMYPHKKRYDTAAFCSCVTLAWWKVRNGFATLRPEEEEEFEIWQPAARI